MCNEFKPRYPLLWMVVVVVVLIGLWGYVETVP